MKQIYVIGILSLAGSLFSACEDINEGGGKDYNTEVEVTFASKIVAYDSNDTEEWDGGESVGVFMKKNKAGFAAEDIVNGVSNRRLIADADGSLCVPENEPSIIFQQDASKVDFVLYHPWLEILPENGIPVDVSDPENKEKYGTLYSNNATGKYKSQSPVKVEFRHIPAKIILEMTNGTGFEAEDLKSLQVEARGVYTAGLLALDTGIVTPAGNIGTISVPVSADGRHAEYVVLPTNELPSSGRDLRFTVKDIAQTYRFDENLRFEMGKQYTLDVVIANPGIEVTIQTIEDWIVDDETGDAVL